MQTLSDSRAEAPVGACRVERSPARLFAPARVIHEIRADGTTLMRSPEPLGAHARCVGEWLETWARRAPDRPFLVERDARGDWAPLTYGEALHRVRAIAAALLALGLGPDRPLAILSDNGTRHALLMLAAMHVGIPVASVSVAYSLASADHAKLRAILDALRPGALYAASATAFAPALRAVSGLHDAVTITDDAAGAPEGVGPVLPFARLLEDTDAARVDAAHRAVGPDTVAKILFTSGSTGTRKGVINTQRMLCSNQQAKRQVWPFLADTPPVIVDWLPWSHTFGANHNFNLVLRNGGTLYVDAGKAAPGPFATTLANLRDVSPTVYFNVPRGFDLLVPALRADAALRQRFFARLQVIFYAAAALPQHLWDALGALAIDTVGEPVPLVSAWGSTETAPLAADCHFQAARAGVIGLPVPGTELKLVPGGDKTEIRVRGPGVTPGYWRAPDLSAAAFDEEGFYRIGDAVRLADLERPEGGLVFDGRIAEDFKLASGTWVNVGALRVRAVEMLAPVAQDVVVSGHDRDAVALLVVPNLAACRALAGLPEDAAPATAIDAPAVRAHVARGLDRLHAASGSASSLHATRALLMEAPLTIDAGEITDKGYVNQRAVLTRRAALVARLHAEALDAAVIPLSGPGGAVR